MILWGNKPALPLIEPDSSTPHFLKILTKKAITGLQRLILVKTEYVWKQAEWLWHKLLWYIECKGKCNFFLPFSFPCSAEGWWFIFLSISVWRRLLLTPGKKGQMACVGGTCRRRTEENKRKKTPLLTCGPSRDPIWLPPPPHLAWPTAGENKQQMQETSQTEINKQLLCSYLKLNFCITNCNYIK